jgi:hypothetical protein
MKLSIAVLTTLVGLCAAGPVDVGLKVSKLNKRQNCHCFCNSELYEYPLDMCLESFDTCSACCDDYVVSAYGYPLLPPRSCSRNADSACLVCKCNPQVRGFYSYLLTLYLPFQA